MHKKSRVLWLPLAALLVDLTNQELNGDGTNWLDLIGIPAIAVLLPEYVAVDWQNNLDGMLAVLQAHAN